MSFSTFVKCLTGVSLAGSASLSPAFFSIWGTSTLQNSIDNRASAEDGLNAQTPSSHNLGVSKERLEKDRQHDECVDENVRLTVRNNSGEEKKVTLSEFNRQYKGWRIVGDADYTPQCSRNLSED